MFESDGGSSSDSAAEYMQELPSLNAVQTLLGVRSRAGQWLRAVSRSCECRLWLPKGGAKDVNLKRIEKSRSPLYIIDHSDDQSATTGSLHWPRRIQTAFPFLDEWGTGHVFMFWIVVSLTGELSGIGIIPYVATPLCFSSFFDLIKIPVFSNEITGAKSKNSLKKGGVEKQIPTAFLYK